ncbi:hypothetical protein LI168_14200 [Desulfovibrio desulfuricans]|uniref:hypothetical protein n=1 Tax=Desulfovibrio desulfuricans TaxID=876 RepID=UPI001D0858BF|nr:hypothetical protein [Desulfovibrio desulfuricans]MCB6543264.1 hypothetical protein [Desulfovibrio desulfuricans]MCB6554369.1 hypothetical protein [Desulfovibrio desulfuricans]MCB6566204.1 hypothetical protein [Desulfovibrio desulfuricans]MCB7347370.1 hypothetical protein [Desulfovibrio desulfuricans]MCQ5217573.1 hypothetical protein [Desulfovibrio desulfuricans]
MARPKKVNAFDEKRIAESCKIEFLHWQYAVRKFYYDGKNNVINVAEFENNYFKVFMEVAQRYCGDYAKINGVFIRSDCALSDANVYYLHGSAPKFIFNIINEIISAYHNSVNDNPEFVFDFIHEYENDLLDKERNSESYFKFMRSVISNNKCSLEYLRRVCLKYGYFPHGLRSLRDAIADYKRLDRNVMTVPESFLRIDKRMSAVRVHFISKSGKCYFEDINRDSIYLYCDIYSDINIDRVIKDVKIAISRRWKRNFFSEIRYANVPNMQVCVSIVGKINIKEIEDEVRYALLCAMNYYTPFKYSFSKEIQDVQWRVLQATHKKLSYLRRFVGLFLWDMVHVLELKLGDIITVLLHAIASEAVLPAKSALPANVLKAIQAWANLILSDGSKGRALEASSMDREYRLACQSIQTMSICQHVAGNTSK